MDFKYLSNFAELGIAGVTVVGLLAFLWFITKGHRDERKEWWKQSKEVQKETNAVLKDLTTVIDTINRSRDR